MSFTHDLEALGKPAGDFDFLVGDWIVDNERLRQPLAEGDQDWYATRATARSITLHNGAISIDEMWYPELGFAGSSIRTYERATGIWSIHWVNSGTGTLQAPVRGRWEEGSLTATGPDLYAGKPIIARYLWHSITPTAATWEQAFSPDDGSSWETNWIMHWQRSD